MPMCVFEHAVFVLSENTLLYKDNVFDKIHTYPEFSKMASYSINMHFFQISKHLLRKARHKRKAGTPSNVTADFRDWYLLHLHPRTKMIDCSCRRYRGYKTVIILHISDNGLIHVLRLL